MTAAAQPRSRVDTNPAVVLTEATREAARTGAGCVPVSPAVRHTTTASVVVVALVAAVVSYAHMQTVAQRSGEGWRSHLLPLSIDGLVVAASMVLLARRRSGLPGGWLAWIALVAGVVASVAANIAAAQPTTTARLVAAWPALAFAVAFELLLQQRRTERANWTGDTSPSSVDNAPLDNSGRPAERADTVPPARDSIDHLEAPSQAGSTDPTPALPLHPGSGLDWQPAGRVIVSPQTAPARPEVPVGSTGASRPIGTVRDDETARDSPGETTASTTVRPPVTVRKRAARTGPGRKQTGPADRSETAGRTGPDREQTASVDRSDEQLTEAVRELADRSTGPLSTYAIKQALRVGSARAARLLAQLDPVPAGAPRTHGAARRREST